MVSLIPKLARSTVRALALVQNGIRTLATAAPSVNKRQKNRYYKYKPQPKMKEEERLELERETAEMRAVTRELANDPEALEQMVTDGLPEEYDVVHGSYRRKWEAKRDTERLRQTVKRKIIERKYFRPPKEVNLLTWAAKEQIKYLNREFPEEWIPDQIAKSFPISRLGAIKLLRSNYVPRNAHQVYKHDERVVENWKLLNDGGMTGGPLAERIRDMLQEGNLSERLNNFGGVPSLPTHTEVKAERERTHKPGLFESLVVNSVPKIEPSTKNELVSDNSDNQRQIARLVAEFNLSTDKKHSNRLNILTYLEHRKDVDSEITISDSDRNSEGNDEGLVARDSGADAQPGRFRRRGSKVESNKNLLQSRLDHII